MGLLLSCNNFKWCQLEDEYFVMSYNDSYTWESVMCKHHARSLLHDLLYSLSKIGIISPLIYSFNKWMNICQVLRMYQWAKQPKTPCLHGAYIFMGVVGGPVKKLKHRGLQQQPRITLVECGGRSAARSFWSFTLCHQCIHGNTLVKYIEVRGNVCWNCLIFFDAVLTFWEMR